MPDPTPALIPGPFAPKDPFSRGPTRTFLESVTSQGQRPPLTAPTPRDALLRGVGLSWTRGRGVRGRTSALGVWPLSPTARWPTVPFVGVGGWGLPCPK